MTVVTLSLEDWKKVARIGHAASTDDDRPILTGLHLTLANGTLTAAATDSYCLATNSVGVEVEEGPDEWDGLILARQALLVEKDVRSLEHYRSKKDHPDDQIYLLIELGEDTVVATIDERGLMFGGETIARTIDLLDGDYPNWRAQFETPQGEPVAEVSLTSEVLTKALKTTGAQVVRYQLGEGRRPVRLTARADETWSALIMPAVYAGSET